MSIWYIFFFLLIVKNFIGLEHIAYNLELKMFYIWVYELFYEF